MPTQPDTPPCMLCRLVMMVVMESNSMWGAFCVAAQLGSAAGVQALVCWCWAGCRLQRGSLVLWPSASTLLW